MKIRKIPEHIRNFFNIVLKDKQRKTIWRIILDLLLITINDKSIPKYYFSRYLYKKDKNNFKDFINNKVLYGLEEKLNDRSAICILNNKSLFSLYFSNYNINIVKNIMFNYKNNFYLGDKKLFISNLKDFEEIINNVVNNYSENKCVFVKKNVDSYGGKNIYKISSTDLPLNEEFKNDIYNQVISSSYIYQNQIKQHTELDKINSSSINTLRIATYMDKAGNVEIFSAFIRFGVRGSFVDNVSSGGCYVGVDINTGTLCEEAHSSISIAGGRIYTRHPDTDVKFNNVKLPYFEKAKELVINAARYIPGIKLVGWDVAIEKSGPILVEGNYNPDLTVMDFVCGGLRKNEVFKKVLSELNK
jgi:hypothetical protein